MSYKIIVDSCCELTEEFRSNVNCEIIPMSILVDDYQIVDDDTFDQADFLRRFAASPTGAKSSCSSPDLYMQAMVGDHDRVYVVTLSSQLSGSYNSAKLAENLYHAEYGEKDIYVFDSRSASCGESQIAFWIREYEEAGLPFEELIAKVEDKIYNRKTFFTLESIEALRKAGRLSNIKSLIANTLNIKPILAGTTEGTIYQAGQARGVGKALSKMIDLSMIDVTDFSDRTLMVTHCNCPERAEKVAQDYQQKAPFKKTVIMDMRGISSMYACDGGIIVTF